MFYIENHYKEVLSLANDYDGDNRVKLKFKDSKLKQLWKIETPNEEGFFNITELLSNKVLSANTASLEIDGKCLQL